MRCKYSKILISLALILFFSAKTSFVHSKPLQADDITNVSHSISDIFKLAPIELNKLEKEQLNNYAKDLISKLYSLLSRVGSKSGEIGGTPNMSYPDAEEVVKEHLDDNVLILSARHSMPFTKQTYKPSDYDNFIISDIHTTHPSTDVLVVRYNIQAPNRVQLEEGLVFSGEKMPRISAFIWNGINSGWQLISHADFDYPSAAICGMHKSINNDILHDDGNSKDLLTAHAFVNKYLNEMATGDPRSMMHPDMQTQFGSGKGWTGVSEFHKPNLSVEPPKNIIVRRRNNIIVVSFSVEPSRHMALGDELIELQTPVIYTILEGENDEWKLISSAVFAIPKKLDNDKGCIQPSIH